MSESKIITVFGATGAQGGGLVRAILDDPEGGFKARAVTRNPDSDKAKALAALGAEVVAGDVDDPASVAKALEGAYGAYFVTFFWDHFSPEKEAAQAKTFAEAAKAAGIQHAIWSTLEDTRKFVPLSDDRMPTLQGKYKVPHFDVKGESNQLFVQAGVPTTFLLTSFYWDNFIHFGMGPQRGPDGKLALNLPMGDRRLPGIAAEDIGRCAYGIFKRPELIGQTVGIAGEHPTGTEMAREFSEALGEEVVYNAVPFDVYRSLGFPGADDLGNMFQFKHDFQDDFRAPRDVAESALLNPRLQSFHQWLQAHADSFATK
ncbi:NmrA/HSCARG family protein [Fimbriimonas ginsengisoli]|uniref:Putative oxidoreductase n=1 Tax=Fimbriimonas ginsengisoli Gsoil 348 TaxID=661478 RepID=A0A068NMK6_FIMGI|nr:NmrA/HSCARG family protein [Fimbriimonas ginsengisoli]AIE84000.1 putative oxidoreductase [Fimbriimonas ginsengisoli Gsoil 348]